MPYAIAQAVSIRTGGHLGSGHPRKAYCAFKASQYFAFIVTSILVILLQVFRLNLGHLFSNDPLVIEVFDRMVGVRTAKAYQTTCSPFGLQAWLMACVAFFDGIQGMCALAELW